MSVDLVHALNWRQYYKHPPNKPKPSYVYKIKIPKTRTWSSKTQTPLTSRPQTYLVNMIKQGKEKKKKIESFKIFNFLINQKYKKD